jgi:hypothetical protein
MTTKINNIVELASHLGAYHDTPESIARRVYKDTSCGCAAGVENGVFWVTGYCEGSDQEHEVYRVKLPCDSDEIDKAIRQADNDGNQTWNETHGCKKCNPDGWCDEWGNVGEPGEVGGPVNPNCPECGGDGIVL